MKAELIGALLNLTIHPSGYADSKENDFAKKSFHKLARLFLLAVLLRQSALVNLKNTTFNVAVSNHSYPNPASAGCWSKVDTTKPSRELRTSI